MPVAGTTEFDYILVGGGLQAGLLVHALRNYQPQASVLLVEREAAFGGNHTWSFHDSDIPDDAHCWLSHVPRWHWSSYRVSFPGFEKDVGLAYSSMTSTQMGETVARALEPKHAGDRSRLLLNTEVRRVGPRRIITTDGRSLSSRCVIDCRGRRGGLHDSSVSSEQTHANRTGYQKFIGMEIELDADWPASTPMLMDARVDQRDGFHFVYVLPFTSRRVLVEDTWFTDSPELNSEACEQHLRSYIGQQTAAAWKLVRKERGCLPMPIRGLQPVTCNLEDRDNQFSLAGGYAGGWFHAATGYSFPLAVRFADAIAQVRAEDAANAFEELRQKNRFQFRFSRNLNRLLFELVHPTSRWQIFRRIYKTLPCESLARFYAHQFTPLDAARMIVGVPPSRLTPLKFLRGGVAATEFSVPRLQRRSI